MTLRERHKSILDLLRTAGSVDVGTLSLRLGVSAVTIRKDLDLSLIHISEPTRP